MKTTILLQKYKGNLNADNVTQHTISESFVYAKFSHRLSILWLPKLNQTHYLILSLN